MLAYHISPGSIQSHSDNPQTPPRHIPDTLQTPQIRHIFYQSKATRRQETTNIEFSIGCLSMACTSYPPDSIQSHSDNPQTPLRHFPDNLQTFRGTWERRNQLIKITLIGFVSINIRLYPHPDNIHTHSDNPRQLTEIFKTPYRHPKIGNSMANPGSILGEGIMLH